jgi:hypothetical protein
MSAATPRPHLFRAAAILILASALQGCPSPKTSPPEPLFKTEGDARAYILARLLASEEDPGPGDPYASTLVRRYTTLEGVTSLYYLVDEPARELALAEGFQAHGFTREALAHYENLVAYHPKTPEGRRALERIDGCRRATVLGFVEPMSVVVDDLAGQRRIPASGRVSEKAQSARIQDPWLNWFGLPLKEPLEAVGTVDDAGGIIAQTRGPRPVKAIEGPLKDIVFDSDGVVASNRRYCLVDPDARTLFEAERKAKAGLVRGRMNKVGEAASLRRAAEDLLYLGFRSEAAEILENLGESLPPNPLDGDLATLLAQPGHPLALDALWLLTLRDHPRFTLASKSCVTATGELSLEIDARAIDRMTFRFARIKGDAPADGNLVKKWLSEAETAPSHDVTVPVPPGKSILLLPVRDPGTWRVTAEARGLSCTFAAVRADAALEGFAMPSEALFRADRPGLAISVGGKAIGTTDEEGLLSVTGPIQGLKGRICAEHRECCSGCDSCDHHHGADSGAPAIGKECHVFVAGRGQFFRATAEFDLTELDKVKAPAPAEALFVHTDRPAYKAGDTMRFRGILRRPRTPLHRRDPSRLDPSPEQPVHVSIRCDETSLFQRTYVTGEFGTFSGEFVLPLTAFRAEYSLVVEHAGFKTARAFEVMDYRKSDYAVMLTPEAGGLRVRAGYVWGAPVPGAEIRATVDGQEAPIKDGFLAAREGQRIVVNLRKGGEDLAQKGMTCPARPDEAPPEAAPEPAAAPMKEEAPAPAASAAEKKEKAPSFRIASAKPVYRRGEEIALEVDAPWKDAEVTIVLGDLQIYDFARVRLRGGRARIGFPARPIHDPGTTAFALCNGQVARAHVRVAAGLMKVEIEGPERARPGEEAGFTLRAEPRAAFSVAAVDEAIYMIREDDTPEIYAHFYPPRPAAIAHARFRDFEFDGEAFKVEKSPSHPRFPEGSLVGDRPFRGKGIYDVIGVGGGVGGRYAGRFGGRRNLVARGGGSANTEDAVLGNLVWLAARQHADGSWTGSLPTEAGTVSTVGATGLALLGFVGAGYSHLSKDTYGGVCFGDVVRKGLQHLSSQQAPDGSIGPPEGDRILNHAIGTLALSEAFGLTGAKPFEGPAQNALNFLTSRPSADGGWHRRDRALRGEILATVFAVMVLKSAQLSGLKFSPGAAAGAARFLGEAVDDSGACASPTRARVAGCMAALIFLGGEKSDPRLVGAINRILQQPPKWDEGDFLGWYFASLSLFLFDGPSGPKWKGWNEPVKNALVPNQARDGSWTVQGESVIHTALASLTLQIYYRYANVFGVGGNITNSSPLAPAPRVRLYFPDTAFWAPEIVTDGNGEARFSFRVPDAITTTRLTARGATKEGSLGQAVTRLETRQPFFVKLQAPEFAVLGDEIEIRADLHNYTKDALNASVRLEGSPLEHTATVPADRPASVSWRVRADDPKGLRLVASARAGRYEDAMERTLPVRRPGRERVVTWRGKSETGGTLPFTAPQGVQGLVLKVFPRRGSLSQLLDALRYLNEYPYG